jgi:hypothetical protein
MSIGSGPAWIVVVILDQPWRGIGVEVIDQGLVADMDLLTLQERRHRHHDRELLRTSLEVVHHRQDRAIAVADEDDLGRLVKEL